MKFIDLLRYYQIHGVTVAISTSDGKTTGAEGNVRIVEVMPDYIVVNLGFGPGCEMEIPISAISSTQKILQKK
jgi:hypothetical protein